MRRDTYLKIVLTKITDQEDQGLLEIERMEIILDQEVEKMETISNSIEMKLVVVIKLHHINPQQQIGVLTAQ